jgi:hypothetical protein
MSVMKLIRNALRKRIEKKHSCTFKLDMEQLEDALRQLSRDDGSGDGGRKLDESWKKETMAGQNRPNL